MPNWRAEPASAFHDAVAGGRGIEPVVAGLLARGAECVVLACTELPVALDAVDSPLRSRCIDSTAALARTCVRLWRARGPTQTSPADPTPNL